MRQLTSTDKKRLIKLLLSARSRVRRQQSHYICFALTDLVKQISDQDKWAQGSVDRNYLCDWVHSMLGSHPTLQDWLFRQGHGDVLCDPKKLRQTRLNWIDWMIGELEAEQ